MDKELTGIVNNYMLHLFKKKYKVEKAFIFGSYAKDTQTKHSDIDIALIFNDSNLGDRFDLQVQLLVLASDIDSRIEPHPIGLTSFNQENPFAAEIIKTGKEIKIRMQ